MRTNLSSLIKLYEVPEKYYRPANALEEAVLTRFEKIPVQISETESEGAEKLARAIAEEIRQAEQAGRKYVLALVGGESPVIVYKKLIALHQNEGLSFQNVVVVVAYEYYPLANDAVGGCLNKIKQEFLNHIDVKAEHILAPNVTCPVDEVSAECDAFEQKIKDFGGIDFFILGISATRSVCLNASGTNGNSRTRLVVLDAVSRKEAAKSMFNHLDAVPLGGISLGLGNILEARRVALVAWGEGKAKQIAEAVEKPETDALPASILQSHPKAKMFVDLSAANLLTRINLPWLVTSCTWDHKLIRRAVVWLCEVTGLPILKLTNKHYTDNGLGELVTKFGSAYNANIQVFNDIQHTITGWPGGKPNADDSNRPERANPFPKRVIVFSPHPDDDVISMGGTFRRLVEQGHDVHVAYQTSGNIAVGDEEVIRYVSLMKHVCEHYGRGGDDPVLDKAMEIRNFLMNEKKEGEPERVDVRFMKGRIRREEASTAARYVGLDEDHIHFLDLPFYETGTVKKGDLGEADIKIVKEFIESIQPHEIFVAGDLADPHGTHKVCLDAILASIDLFKEDRWYKEDCRVWMYRGAWAEWEIEHIEMAVPMSPEELRRKRNSILKHQSQMESAPFLGDDERLFWQRSEDRNQGLAKLYESLGLASYEAIEAFVQYRTLD